MNLILFVMIGFVVKNVQSQVFRSGAQCPQPPVQQDFDVQRFASRKWFEIERYFAIFEMGVRCVTASFEQTSEKNIQMSFQVTEKLSGMPIVINATGSISNPEEPAKISASFMPGLNLNMLNLWVLDTDYDSYAVIWSCGGLVQSRIELGWILSREPTLSNDTIMQIHENLQNVNVQTKDFFKSDQTNCGYDQPQSTTNKQQLI